MPDALASLIERGGIVVVGLSVVSVALWTIVVLRNRVLSATRGRSASRLVENAFARSDDDFHRRAVSTDELERFVVEGVHVVRVHGANPGRLDALARRSANRLAAYRSMLRSLVAAAPLLGLLGTVNGMIETFLSLHGVPTLIGGETEVASGISRALVSTQLGLAIGVPGLVAMRWLERKESFRKNELAEARATLGAWEGP